MTIKISKFQRYTLGKTIGTCDICYEKKIELYGYVNVGGMYFNANYGHPIRFCSKECHKQWVDNGSIG